MSAKVSIVLPVYNSAEYVGEAIGSLLNQTFKDFELMIYNDGSTDQTEKLVLDFKDPRIKYKAFETNQGLINILNSAFDEAQGTYIARMDADDIAMPDRLEKQILFMDQHPEIGVCGTQMRLIDQDIPVNRPCDDDDLRWWIFKGNPMAHPTVVIRNSVLKEHKLKFDINAYVAEDFDLWWRMAFYCKMANLNDELLLYRVHSSQESSAKTNIQIENHGKSLIRFMESIGIDSNKYEPDFIEKLLGNELFADPENVNRTLGFFESMLSSDTAIRFFGRQSITGKRNSILDRQLANLRKYNWEMFKLIGRPEIKESLVRINANPTVWILKSFLFWKTR